MEETTDPIQITPGTEGRLIVRLPFSPERVAKIKTIDGRRWHSPEKYWSVPHGGDMPARLPALFAGERVELAQEIRPKNIVPSDLLERVHEAVRSRDLSPNTEEAYIGWIRRFTQHAGPRPEELGEAEIGRFLSMLAVDAHVSASTQNQALHALLFLYKEVFGKEIG
ncbi:MAG: phage integrase N-terminal SAM-like domain-containing protein [Elusimicrobia bacterium]|nr:phage integrase N-terminal SAM-like domain-containing protein [Elusimicrobiota bacterium]